MKRTPRTVAADLLHVWYAGRHNAAGPADAFWDAASVCATTAATLLACSADDEARLYARAFLLLRTRWWRVSQATSTPKES